MTPELSESPLLPLHNGRRLEKGLGLVIKEVSALALPPVPSSVTALGYGFPKETDTKYCNVMMQLNDYALAVQC